MSKNKSNMVNIVFDIWSNLEQSYETKGKAKNLTREEYFKSLIVFKNGKHGLHLLLKRLNDAIMNDESKTDEDLLDKYSKLTEMFKVLGNYLEVEGIPSKIENLDLFLIEAMGLLEPSITREDILNEFSYSSENDDKIHKFYHRVMLEEFNALVDYVVADKNGVISHYIGVENPSDKFRYFKKEMVYNYLKDGYSSKKFLEDRFNLDCLAVLSILAKLDKLPNNFFVTDKSNVENNKLFNTADLQVGGQYSDSSFNVVEFKFEEISIYCLY